MVSYNIYCVDILIQPRQRKCLPIYMESMSGQLYNGPPTGMVLIYDVHFPSHFITCMDRLEIDRTQV